MDSSEESSEISDGSSDDDNNILQVELRQREAISRALSKARSASWLSLEDVEESRDYRLGNTIWCMCGHCSRMSVASESTCCLEIPEVAKAVGTHGCITLHPGFESVCLNLHSLQVPFYWCMENQPKYLCGLHEHEQYRRIAYRQFTRWVWHRLGKSMHRPVPSCVTSKIRKTLVPESEASDVIELYRTYGFTVTVYEELRRNIRFPGVTVCTEKWIRRTMYRNPFFTCFTFDPSQYTEKKDPFHACSAPWLYELELRSVWDPEETGSTDKVHKYPILVHQPGICPPERLSQIYLRPGIRYSLSITQRTFRRLPAPSASKCTDYGKLGVFPAYFGYMNYEVKYDVKLVGLMDDHDIEALGYIGGYIGLWLGVSLYSIYVGLESSLLKFLHKRWNRIHHRLLKKLEMAHCKPGRVQLFKMAIAAACAVGFLYQAVGVVLYFQSYPAVVSSIFAQDEAEFPAVTVCFEAWFNTTKICDHFPNNCSRKDVMLLYAQPKFLDSITLRHFGYPDTKKLFTCRMFSHVESCEPFDCLDWIERKFFRPPAQMCYTFDTEQLPREHPFYRCQTPWMYELSFEATWDSRKLFAAYKREAHSVLVHRSQRHSPGKLDGIVLRDNFLYEVSIQQSIKEPFLGEPYGSGGTWTSAHCFCSCEDPKVVLVSQQRLAAAARRCVLASRRNGAPVTWLSSHPLETEYDARLSGFTKYQAGQVFGYVGSYQEIWLGVSILSSIFFIAKTAKRLPKERNGPHRQVKKLSQLR
ncbi:hypothetical protein ISCGN_021981 [Ixodes scapularis]